jgi:hypothetical protein
MAFEAYSVAIKLSLINHVSEGLLLISKNMKTAHMDAKKFDSTLASIGKQMAVGGVMFAGGAAIASMFKAPYEEAKKVAQAQADFQTLNLSAAENQKVWAAAATNSHKVLGSEIAENIKIINDLHTAIGHLDQAIDMSKSFTQYATVVKMMNGGRISDGLINNTAKALEHRGDKVIGSEFERNDELNRIMKVTLGSKNRVNGDVFYAASQTGGMGYSLLNKDFLYGKAAAMMQQMSGSTFGTSLMTYDSSMSGHMDGKAKGLLAELGLLQVGVSKKQVKLITDAVASLHLDKEDSKKMLAAMMPVTGGLSDKYLPLALSRPDLFLETVLAPKIREKFGNELTDEQVASLITTKFNRGTSKFLGGMMLSLHKNEKDAAIFNQAMGIGDALKLYQQSPDGGMQMAEASWKNLMAIVGSVYLPSVVSGLEKFAGWLDRVGQSAEKNKEKIKLLVYGVAGLSATLMTGGLINMIAGAARGFGLLYTVMGGFAGFLDKKTGFIGTAMKGVARWMLWPVTYVGGKIGGLFTALGSRIFTSIGALLSPIATRVMPMISGIIMWGLRLIPIVGWVIGLVSLGVYLWRNWDEVVKKAKALWTKYGHYITDGWNWIKTETGKVWDSTKGFVLGVWNSITDGIKSAVAFIWDQWSWLFDKLYTKESLNKVNPGYSSINDALDFNKAFSGGMPGFMTPSVVAPVPGKQNQTVQVSTTIKLNEKTIVDAVTKHQGIQASRPPTGKSGFDNSMMPVMPGLGSALYGP